MPATCQFCGRAIIDLRLAFSADPVVARSALLSCACDERARYEARELGHAIAAVYEAQLLARIRTALAIEDTPHAS